MTNGELEYAVRKAHEQFDRWNDVTGYIPKFSGYYCESLAVLEDAVHIGAMVALGLPVKFSDDGELLKTARNWLDGEEMEGGGNA